MRGKKAFLLDTHILIWLTRGDYSKFKGCDMSFLRESCFISVESLKEMALKLVHGKIDIEGDPKRLFKQIENLDITILDFDKDAVATLFKLPFYQENKDPFDRSIVAHAISKKMILVSEDSQFRFYQKDGLHLQRLK